jgi:prolipoprotein diacylglyceryltransferase
VPIAVIALDFDPVLRLGDVMIRWQTVALAATIFVALCLAASVARRTAMRPDDLLFVVVGIVPGAVIGGRIGAVLAHADFYQSSPGSILDPGQGTLSLSLAVAGGTLSGAIVARLLGTPVRAWLHIAAMPVLFGIAFGKLAMVLSAAGQGLPSDLTWATAYLGPGPWSTLAPEIPSHPSQVYEAIVALAVLALIAMAFSFGVFREPTGRAVLVGIAIWAFGRAIVGMVWRDADVLGPFGVEQVLTLAVGTVFLALTLVPAVLPVPADQTLPEAPRQAGPEWPDPSTRPRF